MSKTNALNKIFGALAKSQPKRSVEFQAFAKLTDGTFKVVMSADASYSEDALSEEISSQTEGRARLIPGSVVRRGNVAVAYAKANAISRPMDASFHMVTASTASDGDGRIWSVVNSGGEKRVVLEAGDDLEGIFSARVNARKTFVNPVNGAGLAVASANNGDSVRYVDTASGKVGYGIYLRSVGRDFVVTPNGETASITPLQVASVVDRRQLPEAFRSVAFEARAELSGDKFNEIVAFLKKCYGEASGPMLDRMREIHNKAA